MSLVRSGAAPARHHHARRRSRTRSRRWRRPAARPTPCCTCSRSRARPACRSTLDDFDAISARTPLHRRSQAGRPLRRDRPAPRRRQRARRASGSSRPACSHGDALTVTGRTLARGSGATRVETPGQEVVRPTGQPLKPHRRPGDPARQPRARRLRWSRSSGTERATHRGPARVFDSEEAAFDAVQRQTIKPGDVVVIRYEGPSGGPGMREMLGVTARDRRRRARRDRWRCVTDGRFSGATRGLMVGHVAPEAARGGPIAAVRDGDIDRRSTSTSARLDVDVPADDAASAAGGVDAARRRATRPACSRSTRSSCRRPSTRRGDGMRRRVRCQIRLRLPRSEMQMHHETDRRADSLGSAGARRRDRRLRLSGRRDSAGLRRDAASTRFATSWCATSRARRTWPTATRARRGKVGVAIATSGPGATNMVTGIATAMMDSSPIVCITGQVGSKLIGSDAFQETDITGITLPITKHNYLVTRAEDVAPAVREAFAVARGGRPGPGARRHHQGRAAGRAARSTGTRPSRTSPRRSTMRCRATATCREAIDADQRRRASADSRRPRRHAVGRRAPDPRARRARADSDRGDAARHRRRCRRRIRSTSA